MEVLAKKSEEGSLSDREREEYEAFVSAGNFVAILQSKARRLLKDQPTRWTPPRGDSSVSGLAIAASIAAFIKSRTFSSLSLSTPSLLYNTAGRRTPRIFV